MDEWQQKLLEEARSGSKEARENLIKSYTTFIMKTASYHCKRKLEWENDDELSVAMLAFNEAIDGYDFNAEKKFENYARMVISSRLIDFHRRESRHHHLSLEKSEEEDEKDASEQGSQGPGQLEAKASLKRYQEKRALEDRRQEMKEFDRALRNYGLSLDLLESSAPKHEKTRDKLVEIAIYIASRPDLVRYITSKKKLPLKELIMALGVSKKVLKRGRQYIIGILLIIIDERFSYFRSLFSLPFVDEHGNKQEDENENCHEGEEEDIAEGEIIEEER